MIYTCYDMVRDCRDGRAQGWSYFVEHYVPVMRRIVARYFPQSSPDASIERVLVAVHQGESALFQSQDPAPERWFVAELRQRVLTACEEPGVEAAAVFDLQLVGEAFEPLTVVEKHAVWLETMRYAPPEAATLLRMEPRTVEKIRGRGAELLRASLDTWQRTVLWDQGRHLGRLAAAARTPECPPVKAFLDVLDGRSTWQRREELERHETGCWHCVDHFCRMAEVIELVRGVEPLREEEAAPFRRILGIPETRKSLWQRWFAQ